MREGGEGEAQISYSREQSPLSMAFASLVFHSSATSLARGSSGLGALRRA